AGLHQRVDPAAVPGHADHDQRAIGACHVRQHPGPGAADAFKIGGEAVGYAAHRTVGIGIDQHRGRDALPQQREVTRCHPLADRGRPITGQGRDACQQANEHQHHDGNTRPVHSRHLRSRKEKQRTRAIDMSLPAHPTTCSSSSTPPRPTIEIVVSITVHDANVCFIDRLKNSLNIQNAESLTCEPNTLPAPTASTISSGDAPVVAISGPTMPAAVITATVAEPIITRSSAVASQAKISGGICQASLSAAICAPTSLSTSTCLNTPPAVMISRITAMLAIAALSHFVCVSRLAPRRWPSHQNATRVDSSRATVGLPRNSSAVLATPSGSRLSAKTDTAISSTGESAIRNE